MSIEDEKPNFKEPRQNGQRRKSPLEAQSSAQAQLAANSQSGSAENVAGGVLGSATDTLITGGQFVAATNVNNVTMVGCTITTEGAISQTQTKDGHPQQTTSRSRKRKRGRMRPQKDSTGCVQTDNKIYECHLREKGRGHPLWIPQSNMALPIAYRAQGVRIGDVGIFTDDGGFDFLFNICVPMGDPINPRELPENFVPIYPSVDPTFDICKFPQFISGSYLASSSVTESRTAEQSSGLTFESSASEGAVLTMPEGAQSERLMNLSRFEAYIGTHVQDWYKYVNGPSRGRKARNGDLRVVVGHDKSTSWGMATFSNSSLYQDTNFRLKFTALENQPSQRNAGNNYGWEYSGVAVVRVGPGPGENTGLGETDSDRLQNQCLFIRSLHVMLSEKGWREVFPQTVVVEDSDQNQSMACPPGSSSRDAHPQSSQLRAPQISRRQDSAPSNFTNYPEHHGTLDRVPPNQMESPREDLYTHDIVDENGDSGMKYAGLTSQLAAEEETTSQGSSDTSSTLSRDEEIRRDSTPTPDVILTYSSPRNGDLHPSQIISQYLLEQVPGATAAVTHDRDWSGIIGTDSSYLDSSQLLSEVRSRNDLVVHNFTGLVSLELKEKDQNGILEEEAKVAGLVESIKDGGFVLDQYLFGFDSDPCLRLQALCNTLQSGSTNQLSMSSFLRAHPERPLSLDEIVKICNGDFHVQGRQSIASLRAELTLLPSQHTDRSNCLLLLSDALSRRFSQWAQTDDLEEAISSYEALLSLIPNSHYQYLEALLGLCSSLYQRFYLLGHADDRKNLLRYVQLQSNVVNQRGLLLTPIRAQLRKLHPESESTNEGPESEPFTDIIKEGQIDFFDGTFASHGLRHLDGDLHSIDPNLYATTNYNWGTATLQTHSPQPNFGPEETSAKIPNNSTPLSISRRNMVLPGAQSMMSLGGAEEDDYEMEDASGSEASLDPLPSSLHGIPCINDIRRGGRRRTSQSFTMGLPTLRESDHVLQKLSQVLTSVQAQPDSQHPLGSFNMPAASGHKRKLSYPENVKRSKTTSPLNRQSPHQQQPHRLRRFSTVEPPSISSQTSLSTSHLTSSSEPCEQGEEHEEPPADISVSRGSTFDLPIRRPKKGKLTIYQYDTLHDKYYNAGRMLKHSGDARFWSTYPPTHWEYRPLPEPPQPGSSYHMYGGMIARLELLDALLCFIYSMWSKDYSRRSCNRETWGTIEAFLLWCRQKWEDGEKGTGGSNDTEKAFVSLIWMLEGFIQGRKMLHLVRNSLRKDMEKVHSTTSKKIAAAAEEATAAGDSNATRLQMLPSPDYTPVKRDESKPDSAGSRPAPPAAAQTVQLPARYTGIVPHELVPEYYLINGPQPIPDHVMKAMANVTEPIGPTLIQGLKDLTCGISAMAWCMSAQNMLTLPIMRRCFPKTWTRMMFTTLLPTEEHEPDFEDEEGELYWPGQCVNGEGIGWVCLMGKAMINEFGKAYGYKGLDGVVRALPTSAHLQCRA